MGSADHRWAHQTPSLNGLSYRFAVRSDDARLGSYAETVLAGLRGEGPVEHWYSLTRSTGATGPVGSSGSSGSSGSAGLAEHRVDVTIDEEPGAQGRRPGDALGWIVWHANQAAAAAGRKHLLFHAGGVCAADAPGPGGLGVLMPGPSGSGKSTLTAGLVRAGLSYLSDELVALDLGRGPATAGRLLPYAKPITVKAGSFGALRAMAPERDAARDGAEGGEERGDEQWGGEEWLLPVGEAAGRPVAGPCAPGVVVVPRFRTGVATALTPLSETEAFVALAVNAVNFTQHGEAGARALGELVARCACVELTMSDLDQACALVVDLVATTAAAPTTDGLDRAR